MKTTRNARCMPGLEIQRVVEPHAETVARAAGVDDFGVQVGIETGLVVIGPIGGGSHQETGATGDGRERGAGRSQQAASFAETSRAFAVVAGVIAIGWVGVRFGVFDRFGSRVVPSTASRTFVGVALLAWVFVLAGLTNLDVAVVAAAPLALVVAADRGIDGALLALGVAQVANAGSILL